MGQEPERPKPDRDETKPEGKWEFNDEVTRVFDDMLRRSIPEYDQMRRLCFDLGRRFVQHQTDIVDLGCSRGEALAPFVDRYGATCSYVGVECSGPMLDACRARWEGLINAKVIRLWSRDLRHDYPLVQASLTLSVLTLQFIPIECRQAVVRNVYKSLKPGGAFIMVEKVLGDSAELNHAMVEEYHAMKRANGYSPEDVDRKRLSLQGVLVPVTAKWNVDLLRSAGFGQVDCFWRWLNFAGWIGVKEA